MAKGSEHDSAQNSDNTYTQGIARFVAGLTYDKIPREVIERIKLLILDSLGCGIYGSSKEHCKMVIDTISKVDTSNGGSIWGTKKRVSVPHAALVNGTLIQSFELDDVHRKGAMHVGATTLPGLFAIAETRPGMSGQQLLTAAVAGYEVGPRVGACMGANLLEQGWHSGAVMGVYSGAATAASALGLSEEKTVHALGIAGTQASGLMAAQYGAMVKRMHHGKAAQSGVYGALLAENGFTGIVNVFESDYGGFCTTFTRSKDRFKLPELTRDLGKTWETMMISLKFYSAAASNHTTLDAIQIMRERHPFTADQVERVVVHGSQVTKEHIFWPYEPAGTTNAQMCMPYIVATLLLEGDFMVDQVRDDMLADPTRIALSRKVDFIAEPEITKMGLRYYVRVEIFLKDGTRLEETLEAQRGSETKFATEADVVGKFEKLAKAVFQPQQIAAIRDAILGLDRLDDTSKLAADARLKVSERFKRKAGMNYKTITTQQDEAAYVITLNRPEKRNAVSIQMMGELIDAVTAAEAEASVRAIIITGGTSFFGAGADLNEPLQIKHAAEGIKYFKRWHKLCGTMEELAKPVIAAIEGFCITGALEFALACDIRVAAEGSSFAITSSKIGTVAGAGGTQRLPRIVGIAHALDIMMSAEPVDAKEAYRIGLINRLVPKGEALSAAKALVKVYAQRAPLSLAFVKRVVYRGMQMDLASAIEFETFLVSTIYTSEDRKEGISAFLEKRSPKFKGR